MLLSYCYLKSLKNLKSLVLDVSDGQRQPHNPKRFERISAKFFQFLQGTKLERVRYQFQHEKTSPAQEVFNFPQLPSSLKSWVLFLSEKLKNIKNIEKLLNLSRLQGLVRFEMLTSLPLDLLNLALESITDQLKTLVFKVTLTENHCLEEILSKARTLLAKYQGLEHLSITSDAWIDLFSVNETPLYPWKLKSLEIQTRVPDGENLKKLKEVIGSQQECIESLNLHLGFEKEPETFIEEVCDFSGLIGRLKRLKALKILFSIHVKPLKKEGEWFFSDLPTGVSEINALPICPLLINVMNELKD